MIGFKPDIREVTLLQRLHAAYRLAMSKPQRVPLKDAKPDDVDAVRNVLGLKAKPKTDG